MLGRSPATTGGSAVGSIRRFDRPWPRGPPERGATVGSVARLGLAEVVPQPGDVIKETIATVVSETGPLVLQSVGTRP